MSRSRIWPAGDPVVVTPGPAGLPQAFWWRGSWHQVTSIANRWRVLATWWSDEAWREYFKVTTADGVLCTLYHDLRSDTWFCARLYD